LTNNSNKLKSLIHINIANILKNVYGVARVKVTAILLGVTGVGILGQLFSMYSLETRLSSFGIDAIFVSKLSKIDFEENQTDYMNIISSLFFLVLLINFILIFLFFYFSKELTLLLFDDSKYESIFLYTVILAPFFSLSYFFEMITQSKGDYSSLVKGRNIGSLLALFLVFPLIKIYSYYGILLSILIMICGSGIYFLYINLQYIKLISLKRLKYAKTVISEILKIGFIDIGRKISVFVSLIVFRIFIVQFLGMDQNGYFQSVWSITLYLNVFIGAFTSYYYPVIGKVNDKSQLNNVINENLYFLLLYIFPLTGLIIIFPDWILTLLFSAEFVTMKYYLAILVFFKLCEAIYMFYNITFIAQTMLRAFLFTEVLRSMILIFTSYFLINEYQLSGAIISVISMEIGSILILIYYIKKNPAFLPSKKLSIFMIKMFVLLLLLLIPTNEFIIYKIIKMLVFIIGTHYIINLRKYFQLLKTIFVK